MYRQQRITVTIFLVSCWLAGTILHAQGTVTAERFPTAVADGGGTGTTGYPYAVFVRIQGSTPNAQVFLKVFNVGNNEYMWSATNVWSNGTAFLSSNQPAPTLDASGNWVGWIYAKHNTTVGATVSVRFRIGGTSTNITSSSRTLNILSMSPAGTGGWIVRASSPAVNKAIAAYTGTNLVGSYRTEENNITEGYAYSAGGFKIAVPAGIIDSLVSYNDDGSRDQLFVGPWVVTAGQETDASASGGQVGHGSASLSPGMVAGGILQQVVVSIRGEIPYTLTNARVVFPAGWTWSGLPGDITLIGGGSPSASVAGIRLS